MPKTAPVSRIAVRISPDIYALIKRAAELDGRTISDFVTHAASLQAQRVIEQREVVRFGRDSAVTFADLMTEPGAPLLKLAECAPLHIELAGDLP